MGDAPSGVVARFLKPGKRSARRGRVACIVLVLFFLCLMALGEATRWNLALDVLSHFRLQLVFGALAFAVGAVLPRARVLAGIVLVIVALVGIGLYPQITSEARLAPEPAPAGSRALHVMSFNISLHNARPAAVLAEINRVNPDLIMLIELHPDQRELLAGLAAMYPYRVDCLGQSRCYLAMFSRYPISRLAVKRDARPPNFIAARLGPVFGNAAVFGLHALRFPHVRPQLNQLRSMARVLDENPGSKLVVGDFNATGFSFVLREFEEATGLKRLTSLPSWPATARLPQIGIDHIFASPDILPLEAARTGRYAGSDHYPVHVRVGVPSP